MIAITNHPLRYLIFFLASLLASQVHSHSSAVPEHGGIVELTGEMSFELVVKEGRVELYVVDDGEPVDSSELSALLRLRTDDGNVDIALQPDGGNRFAADGVDVPDGSRVTAVVTLANGFTRTGAVFDLD